MVREFPLNASENIASLDAIAGAQVRFRITELNEVGCFNLKVYLMP